MRASLSNAHGNASGIPGVDASSPNTGRRLLDMTTLEERTFPMPTSSSVVSLARTFQPPENKSDSLDLEVDFGSSICESSNESDPAPSLSRMSLDSSQGVWTQLSKGSTAWVIRWRQRGFELPISAPPTIGRESFCWPTPMKCRAGQNVTPRELERLLDPEDNYAASYLHLQVGGRVNPEWVEVLMGAPIGWTDIDGLPDEG